MDGRVEKTTIEHSLIRSQLDRILEHPEFHATEKMHEFLRFVVEETLAGNARHLKGFTIAMEVFGRGRDFDAAHDPVVRIQAGRLRRALERYYLVAGGEDPVVIDIPKGAYVPVFTTGPLENTGGSQGPAQTGRDPVACWPSVLVCPFEDLTGRPELAYLAGGLATELCMELANTGDIRVMLFVNGSAAPEQDDRQPDFAVQGSVRAEGDTIKVVVQLVVPATGELLWSNSIKSSLEAGHLLDFQEQTAAVIAAHIAGQHGAIFRSVTSRSDTKPEAYGLNYEAILKGYAYHQKITPESYEQAFSALRQAYAKDNGCGLVCSMLALLYVDNIALEYFDTDNTPLAEAQRLAHQGVQLLPQNQLSRVALARVHLLNDELEAGLQELEETRAHAPDSVLWMDVIGYLTVLLGGWERGECLVRRAIELNPYHRALVRYATWACCVIRRDFEKALEETSWLNGVGYFWDPLCRAATLGQLGRLEEGRAAVEELLAIKPDFPSRGHVLINHYIKFPELRAPVMEGLAAVGLVLD